MLIGQHKDFQRLKKENEKVNKAYKGSYGFTVRAFDFDRDINLFVNFAQKSRLEIGRCES